MSTTRMTTPLSHERIRFGLGLAAIVSLVATLLFHASYRSIEISDSIIFAAFSSSSSQTNGYCVDYPDDNNGTTNHHPSLRSRGNDTVTAINGQEEAELPVCPASALPLLAGDAEVTTTAIRIATTLDENYFDWIFPSWLHALSKSNRDNALELYILTVALSPKKRCLLRTAVKLWLPHAVVYTIPVDTAEFQARYFNKGGHISVATQARLRIASLLPCVDKIAWIDLDAFVVRSLNGFWNQPVVAPCGITARLDSVKYLNTIDLPNNLHWHDTYGYSFNAGVLLLSLDTLRRSGFEEEIVQYWGIDLGYNDQVVLNMACNGTYGILNETMNMLATIDFAKSSVSNPNWLTHLYYPLPNEWVIAHFVGSQKPWSTKPKRLPDFNQIWLRNKLTMVQALKGQSALDQLLSFLS